MKFKIDTTNYRRYLDTEAEMFVTKYQTDNEMGDCMLGVEGARCSVGIVKRKLLDIRSERWTLTLDMCRSGGTRGAARH